MTEFQQGLGMWTWEVVAGSETQFNVPQHSEFDTLSLTSLKRERFLDVLFVMLPLSQEEKNFTPGIFVLKQLSL